MPRRRGRPNKTIEARLEKLDESLPVMVGKLAGTGRKKGPRTGRLDESLTVVQGKLAHAPRSGSTTTLDDFNTSIRSSLTDSEP